GQENLPFTTTETEGTTGATVVTTNPDVNSTLLDFTDILGPTAAGFSVTITWGDGTPASTFLSTDPNAPVQVVADGTTAFLYHVVLTPEPSDPAHVYDEAPSGNQFTIQVTDVG